MSLPDLEFTNNFWELGTDEQTLLYTKSVGNNLPYYPGYSLNLTLSRIIQNGKFSYRRQQSVSGLLPDSIKIAARIQGNYISGVLSFKTATVNYVQNNAQTNLTDLSQNILDTKTLRGVGLTDRWDKADRWYCSEQSLYAPFGIEYAGQPTTAEKNLVASFVIKTSSEDETQRSGGSSRYSAAVATDKLAGDPNFDYRPYRPLSALLDRVGDSALGGSPQQAVAAQLLIDAYTDLQVPIETLLAPKLKYVLSGQQLFKSISARTYQSENLPNLISNASGLINTAVDRFLADVTPYIVV